MTLTAESLAMLAGFARYVEPRKAMADRLAAIEAAAVRRALTPERVARALHDECIRRPSEECHTLVGWMDGPRHSHSAHHDHAAAIITALEAQP